MYQYLDGRVIDLREGERVLVWAMRRWLLAVRRGECPLQPVGAMFSAHRVLPGLASFHEVMDLVSRRTRQNLAFAPLRCRRIADGEALLLSMIRGVLHRPPAQTFATATLIVGDPNADVLISALVSLAAALAEAGLAPAPSY